MSTTSGKLKDFHQPVADLIEDLEERVQVAGDVMAGSTDRGRRREMQMEIIDARQALRWLPDAHYVKPEKRTYGCRESRSLQLPAPPDVVMQPIIFRRHTFTTDDPVTIARIEFHIKNGNSPAVEQIPVGHVPNFNRKAVFLSWTTNEEHIAMVEREAAEPNHV